MTLNDARRQERADRGAESWTQRYKRGDSMPAAINSHMEREHGAWETGMTTETRLTILNQPDERDIIAVMERFEVAQPDVVKLALPEQIKIAQLVDAYDAQPFHFHIQGYRNKDAPMTYSAVLTFEGRLFCAKQQAGTLVSATSRAMTQQERIDNDIPEGQAARISSIKMLVPGTGMVEVGDGIGRAGPGKDDHRGGSPIAMANRQEMADTRSKRRGLSEAFPLGVQMPVLSPSGVLDMDDLEVEVSEIDPPPEELLPPGVTTTTLPARDTPVGTVVTNKPDLEPTGRLSPKMYNDVVRALAAVNITSEMVEPTGIDIRQARREGFSPSQIVAKIQEVLVRNSDEEVTSDDQTELPW